MDLKNPWTEIPDEPDFVLPQDEPYVRSYNALCTPGASLWVNLKHTPEPRHGPVDAPVYILLANPSYSPDEPDGPRSGADRQRALASIRDDSTPHLGIASANPWWRTTLGQLIKRVGTQKAARGICSVEFFPYPSRKFGHGHIRLPSQRYTFSLVEKAANEGRTIIVTRTAQEWFGAVPELARRLGHTVFRGKNVQRTFITRGNLPEGVFDGICEAISANG